MAIWISSNIDIHRWKFKNRAPTSCSPGPILWPPTISFELHAEMAEEIDLEKCTFHNFGSSVTLTLDRVEVTLACICGRGLPTHHISWKSEKLFVDVLTYGRTDTPEFQSIRSSPRRGPNKMQDFAENFAKQTRPPKVLLPVGASTCPGQLSLSSLRGR